MLINVLTQLNQNIYLSIIEGAKSKSNGIDASLLCSNQEEADTLLISHALHVFFQIAGKITIMTLLCLDLVVQTY